MKVYDEDRFLWHFQQDDSVTTVEKGRFYCPIYTKTEGGRQVRKSRHLFFIVVPRDDSGECVFVEIGPDGYVNRTQQSADLFAADIDRGDLLPVEVVLSFGKPPEETINILKKYDQ